jgi:serine/threonine protein kinase
LTIPCPNCGRLNRPGARYCATCQTPLAGTTTNPIQPGQLLDGGSYRIVQPLGKGGMGAVWLVAQTKAFDRLAVLKEVVEYYDPFDPDEREKAAERFEAEARTLGDLKHPGIPDLYAYFSEGGHNYLVMEYIEGPDLSQGLTHEDGDTGRLVAGGPFPPDQVLRYTIQICEVLEYLAGRQPPVVHNDIKPGNIIVDEHSKRAVLVDFGTAKTRHSLASLQAGLQAAGKPEARQASIYGTVGYAAPELFHGRSEPRSDVYSLAATAYHLLTDDDPRDHPMQYPLLDVLPPRLVDILRAALAQEIEQRLTATEFRQQLEGYLSGLTGPLRALTFPDGDAADERDELLAQAVKHWDYTAGILHDGTIAHWLRNALHDPVAAQAAEAALQQWPNNPDAALDTFIRQLSPDSLSPGQLELRTTTIHLADLAPGQQVPQQIAIANKGQGYLHGQALSSQPWLKVGNTFSCPPGKSGGVPIEIDTTNLSPGLPHLGAVSLTPVGGLPEVVAVQVTVSASKAPPPPPAPKAPSITVSPGVVDFGIVSRKDRRTSPLPVTVTNAGREKARVQVEGVPQWLSVEPRTFQLSGNAKQVVQITGKIDKMQKRKELITLFFAVDGGEDIEVEVKLEVQRRGLFW